MDVTPAGLARDCARTRRALAAVIGAACGTAAAAACGQATSTGTAGGAGGAKPPPAKQHVTIRVTARQNPEKDMWPLRVPAFQEKYPNVTLEPDLHAGDIQEKIANALGENYQGSIPHNYRIPDANAVLKKALTAVQKNEAEPTPSFLKNLNAELQAVLDLPR
jgi:ABC-type glycerol-3-phosphate transport system substrate-binding protein